MFRFYKQHDSRMNIVLCHIISLTEHMFQRPDLVGPLVAAGVAAGVVVARGLRASGNILYALSDVFCGDDDE